MWPEEMLSSPGACDGLLRGTTASRFSDSSGADDLHVQPLNKRLGYVSFLSKERRTGVLQDIIRERVSLSGQAVNVRRLFINAGSSAITHGGSALQFRRLQASGVLAATADGIAHVVGVSTAVQGVKRPHKCSSVSLNE